MRTLLGVFVDRPSAGGAGEEVVVRGVLALVDPLLVCVVVVVVPGHV